MMDKIHFNKLIELSFWFVEDGLGEYYKRKDTEVYKHRVGDPKWFINYGDAVWISDYIEQQAYHGGPPEIDINHTLARIRVYFKNLESQTECFLRTTYNGEIYEYWVIKLWKNGSGYRDAKFILAKAKNIENKRSILKIDKQFFEHYKIDDNFSVVFPKELDVLYRLKAWIFKDNFLNSDLKNFMVALPEKNTYKIIPISD